MSKNKKETIPSWALTGHSKPKTRREFLAHGLIPFAAALTLPSWANLLIPDTALAAPPLCAQAAGGLVPMMTLNLAGGAAIMSNYMPQDQGGQMLPSYSLRGLGKTPPIEREFGNVPFAGNVNGVLISKFLQGIRETAPTALPKTAFVALCGKVGDDTSMNRFAVDGMMIKAGLLGSLLPTLGTRDTASGINGLPAVISPPTPLQVNGLNSITQSLGYTAQLSNLKAPQKVKLAKLISGLSESQSRKLASVTNGDQVKNVLDCAGVKNEGLLAAGTGSVDLRKDALGADLSTVWGVNANTGNNDQNLVLGSIAYNVIKGQASSGAITLGDYDYHNNTRTKGDGRDLEAGQAAGRILETAAKLNLPVFLLVCTDGAVISADSDLSGSPWSSDSGDASGMYLIYFNPNGRAETSGYQIGHFTSGQVADQSTVIGNNPEAAAAAVFANYLAINKRLGMFSGIVPRNIFDSANLDKVLKFA